MDTRSTKDAGDTPAATIPMSDAFRETFAFLFDPGEAETVRRFGDLLQERMLDRGVYQERNPDFSFTVAEMFAVAADLRFLGSFLRGVSSERNASELTATEQSLSALAEQLAPEVDALAGRLEEEIESLISDDEGEQAPTPDGDL